MSKPRPLYDDPALAEAYARVSAHNVANDAYERPAVRALLGDVRGVGILDAGCAAAAHSAWLVDAGARVVAFDASAAMVELARARLGERARVEQADFERPLPFAAGAFDVVLCSLALHYVRDWALPLAEFARVLRPRGRLVVSTHHPLMTADLVDDYHAVVEVADAWSGFAELPVGVRYFHRPLARIVADVLGAGFTLRGLAEPLPLPEADARDAAFAQRLRTRPGFLIVDAEAAPR